jgi:hypothetical protein
MCHHQSNPAPQRHSSEGGGCARTEGASSYHHLVARYKDVASNPQQQPNPCVFVSIEHLNFHQCYIMGPHSHHPVCTSTRTRNNQPFAPLADKESGNPTNHAPTDCSSNNVMNMTSDHVPAHTQLRPDLSVTPPILRCGQAIPMSPLIAPTQKGIQQTCNKSQHAPTPRVPTLLPSTKPTRATLCKPTTPPTIYPPTKPITPFNTHPSPAYIEPNNDDRDKTPAPPNRLAIQIN